jgi:hypothetical protein
MSNGNPAIDTDPQMLSARAEAALHAATQTWAHLAAEVAAADGDYDKLMSTLRAEGPYAYAIQPQIYGDGTVRVPVLSSFDEIRAAYEVVRGRADVARYEALIDIRGEWYSFHETVSAGHVKGEPGPGPSANVLSIYTSGKSAGITGEMAWPRLPLDLVGKGTGRAEPVTDPIQLRSELLALHDTYTEALGSGDVDGIMETLHVDVQSAVRDYVNETGALVELPGSAENRAYYSAFFEKFEVLGVELLHRVVQDWYVFAELRMTVRPRAGGPRLAFHTAGFDVVANDGRFFVRIAFGTDPAVLP